jgi:hypothetical protein
MTHKPTDLKRILRPLPPDALATVRGGDAGPVGDPEYRYVPVRR